MSTRLFLFALLAALCLSHLCAAQGSRSLSDSSLSASGSSADGVPTDDPLTERLEVNSTRFNYSADVVDEINKLNTAARSFLESVDRIMVLSNATRDLIEEAGDNVALALKDNARAKNAAGNASAYAKPFRSRRAEKENSKVAAAAASAELYFDKIKADIQTAAMIKHESENAPDKVEKWTERIRNIVREFNVKYVVSPNDEKLAAHHAKNTQDILAETIALEKNLTEARDEATLYTAKAAAVATSTKKAADEAEAVYRAMLTTSFEDDRNTISDSAVTPVFASNVALLLGVIAATFAAVN